MFGDGDAEGEILFNKRIGEADERSGTFEVCKGVSLFEFVLSRLTTCPAILRLLRDFDEESVLANCFTEIAGAVIVELFDNLRDSELPAPILGCLTRMIAFPAFTALAIVCSGCDW